MLSWWAIQISICGHINYLSHLVWFAEIPFQLNGSHYIARMRCHHIFRRAQHDGCEFSNIYSSPWCLIGFFHPRSSFFRFSIVAIMVLLEQKCEIIIRDCYKMQMFETCTRHGVILVEINISCGPHSSYLKFRISCLCENPSSRRTSYKKKNNIKTKPK